MPPISRAEKDINYFKEHGFLKKPDNSYNYFVEIDGISYTKPSEAGAVLLKKVENKELGKVLSGFGVDMYLAQVNSGTESLVKYSVISPSGLTYGNKELSENPTFAGMAIIHAIEQTERVIQKKGYIASVQQDIQSIKESMNIEWEGQAKLNTLLIRQKEIQQELSNTRQANEASPCKVISETSSPKEQNKTSEIVTGSTKSGSSIFLVKFKVTFDYHVYKEKIEPLLKNNNGFWNKIYKAVIFKSHSCAELFQTAIETRIMKGEIPVKSWKTKSESKSPKAVHKL